MLKRSLVKWIPENNQHSASNTFSWYSFLNQFKFRKFSPRWFQLIISHYRVMHWCGIGDKPGPVDRWCPCSHGFIYVSLNHNGFPVQNHHLNQLQLIVNRTLINKLQLNLNKRVITLTFKKARLSRPSGKYQAFCSGLNGLKVKNPPTSCRFDKLTARWSRTHQGHYSVLIWMNYQNLT